MAQRPVLHGLLPGGRHDAWSATPPAYVALDVDGTLVHGAPVPEPDVLAAASELVRLGVRVGLATGRMASSTDALLATGTFTGPHVFHNGALITGLEGEQAVLGLSESEVDGVLAFGRTRDDLSVEIYVGTTYLVDRDDARSAGHARLLGVRPSGTIGGVEDLAGQAAVKAVVVCFSRDAAATAVEAVRALGLAAGPAASPSTPDLRYVNVTRAGVDKGSGVATAATSLGLELRAVAAVGDETNDVPVLTTVGTGIAMGDARRDVRDAAHLVAPRFADGGALTALRGLAALIAG